MWLLRADLHSMQVVIFLFPLCFKVPAAWCAAPTVKQQSNDPLLAIVKLEKINQ